MKIPSCCFPPSSLTLVLALALGGCASAGNQRPVLYPNDHLNRVGQARAQEDVDHCQGKAQEAGLSPTGGSQVLRSGAEGAAVGAAAAAAGSLIRGSNHWGQNAAAGAAAGGAAGAVHGAFRGDKANPVYRNFVQRCLRDLGYDVIGWN